MSFDRLRRGFRNLLFAHRMPAAMASWRLLLPTDDPHIRAHRAFWRHLREEPLPLSVTVGLETLVWLRWVLWFAWIDTWRAVRANARDATAGGGPGHARQTALALRLALVHSIPPDDVYEFALYRPERRADFWRHIYGHETQAYHRWRSAGRGDWSAATALLSDKLALTDHLRALSVPVAPILAVNPRGATPDFARWLRDHPALFCKTRRGSRGEGAFSVSRDAAGAGFTVALLRAIDDSRNAGAALLPRLLAKSDYLIQPKLSDHPRLAALSNTGRPIELRVITEHALDTTRIHSAYVQVTVQSAKDPRWPDWLSFPVDIETGRVTAPASWTFPPRLAADCVRVLAALGEEPLPFWPVIRNAATHAHQGVLTGAATIAWDVLITPQGPRFLEGNSGWGIGHWIRLGEAPSKAV